jgi:hypothetical protein
VRLRAEVQALPRRDGLREWRCSVIARSVATKQSSGLGAGLDGFASLAMTRK